MTNTAHQTVRDFEVVSLNGRNLVTIILNGQSFDLSVEAAAILASDIRKAAKRAWSGQ